MSPLVRSIALVVGVAIVSSFAGACSKDVTEEDGAGAVVLDGRPRLPDEEGIVEEVSRDRITLDGGRTYRVSPKLQSFATQTMQAVPLLGREGQFVHVGLDGDTMVWFATIAEPFPGEPPTAYYTGVLEKIQGGRAYFRDGTVLSMADAVTSPVAKGFVQVEIDPVAREVRKLALP